MFPVLVKLLEKVTDGSSLKISDAKMFLLILDQLYSLTIKYFESFLSDFQIIVTPENTQYSDLSMQCAFKILELINNNLATTQLTQILNEFISIEVKERRELLLGTSSKPKNPTNFVILMDKGKLFGVVHDNLNRVIHEQYTKLIKKKIEEREILELIRMTKALNEDVNRYDVLFPTPIKDSMGEVGVKFKLIVAQYYLKQHWVELANMEHWKKDSAAAQYDIGEILKVYEEVAKLDSNL